MNIATLRAEEGGDAATVGALIEHAFAGPAEARLVEDLRRDGDIVLALVAVSGNILCGHVLFSRLFVVQGDERFPALALAPLAVDPAFQHRRIGSLLVEEAHRLLRGAGESLAIVLGEPAYYGRFGYGHARAAGFDSAYQSAALQALAWEDEAPTAGRLDYPAAFSAL